MKSKDNTMTQVKSERESERWWGQRDNRRPEQVGPLSQLYKLAIIWNEMGASEGLLAEQ